ncbi:MAG: peptide chain release factor N(5)-glutamine methyltransferase [Ruminococcaceae bacterium]|nr:peptide chain release factor N(5)-glutamine methyltransferase [Oscillospiraceae bacterium]
MTERELSFLKEHFKGHELDSAVKRVECGEPLAYVIGEWYFWDETFKLNDACLIPRPDTEHLVEHGLKRLKKGMYFADLCCGSGCIGLSLLKHTQATRCLFVDISVKALEMTRLNAERIGVIDRCELVCADLNDWHRFSDKRFDMIFSNPPYIATDVIRGLETVKHEPFIALDGGKDGLDFYRILIDRYLPLVKNDGSMLLEIGYDQKEDIESLCDCKVFNDYGGNPRVAIIDK